MMFGTFPFSAKMANRETAASFPTMSSNVSGRYFSTLKNHGDQIVHPYRTCLIHTKEFVWLDHHQPPWQRRTSLNSRNESKRETEKRGAGKSAGS